MNSDPTGYFTLFEMSAVLNIQSKIKTASVSAAIGGLMSMMDALLGGERDPLNLVKSFASGAVKGFAVGAVFGRLTAVANAGGAYANVALMTKLGLASLGVGLGGISTAQSFSEGKYAQGVFRGINTAIGVHGLKKAFGSAMATFKSSGNSVSPTNTTPNNVVNKGNNTISNSVGNKLTSNNSVGNYLSSKAPQQVTPGTWKLEGQYINDLGKVQPWKAYYDNYGRLIARTDYNAGNIAQGILDTHYHLYEWGPGKTPYEYGSHIGGEFIP